MTSLTQVELQLIGCLLRGDEAGVVRYSPARRESLDHNLRDLFAMDSSPALHDLTTDILAAAAQLTHHHIPLPVQFPCWSPRQWQERASLIPILNVRPRPSGRILIGPEPNVAAPVLGWARHWNSTATTPNPQLYTEDLRFVDPRCLTLSLSPLLHRYNLPSTALDFVRHENQPVHLTFSLSLPARHATAWRCPPGERDEDYTSTYRRLSVALQRTLRAWIPYLYFSSLERFDHSEECHAMLVYRGTQPFPGRNKSQFTYDVLDPSTQEGAFYASNRSFPPTLLKIRDLLRANGMADQSMHFLPGRAESIFAHVRRRHKRLDSLFVTDTNVVNRFHRLALDVNAAARPRDLWNAASAFQRQLQHRLRHVYCGNAWPEMMGLLMLEATAALSGAGRVTAELRLRCASGREATFKPSW